MDGDMDAVFQRQVAEAKGKSVRSKKGTADLSKNFSDGILKVSSDGGKESWLERQT